MRNDLLLQAADLVREDKVFAVVTVVSRKPPSSVQLGDAAFVTEDGSLHGWVGGSCTQSVVVAEALRALTDGRPRLIALAPQTGAERRSDATAYPMSCHSGGSVEIHVDPVLPAPRLLVFGDTPTTRALVTLAKAMGYTVHVVAPGAQANAVPGADAIFDHLDTPGLQPRQRPADGRTFAVVATMGDGDEEAILMALAQEPDYLAVVASKKRFRKMRAALARKVKEQERLAGITNPAGLDIGARTAEEIAVSILAEIVASQRAREAAVDRDTRAHHPAANELSLTRDPVCGMPVEPETAPFRSWFRGRAFFFCSEGCHDRFTDQPESYGPTAERR